MRTWFFPLCAALGLAACSEKDTRPAKEVVAQAKAAAADAQASAREAAASVKATADEAKQSAETATAKADRAVTDAVSTAAQTTRDGAEKFAQGVRELGEGGVVTGRVATFSRAHLALRPETKGPAELRVDDRTRYLLHGGSLSQAALPRGTRVKATYVVEAQVPVATEVEVLR